MKKICKVCNKSIEDDDFCDDFQCPNPSQNVIPSKGELFSLINLFEKDTGCIDLTSQQREIILHALRLTVLQQEVNRSKL